MIREWINTLFYYVISMDFEEFIIPLRSAELQKWKPNQLDESVLSRD